MAVPVGQECGGTGQDCEDGNHHKHANFQLLEAACLGHRRVDECGLIVVELEVLFQQRFCFDQGLAWRQQQIG